MRLKQIALKGTFSGAFLSRDSPLCSKSRIWSTPRNRGAANDLVHLIDLTDSADLIDLFDLIYDLIDVIYIIDIIDLVDSIILIAYV